MGRLDEQAKHRIVILRKAGLSFRKIKKVLELDNIKVTPQAIYLFLKRKKIEPDKSSPASQPQTISPRVQPWGDRQPWTPCQETGQKPITTENKLSAGHRPTQVVNQEEGIKIVSVTSLSKSNHAFQATSSNQRLISQGQIPTETLNRPQPTQCLPVAPPQLHGRARTPVPAPRNPALLVTKKIVDRAIHLQKKVNVQNGAQIVVNGTHYPVSTSAASRSPSIRAVSVPSRQVKDASIQTALSFPPPRPSVSAEQLDSVRGDIHRLTQAVHTLMERQNRWEQEQHRQQQSNHQELLQQIQQLGATLTAKAAQNCSTYATGEQMEATLPDFGPFKMELL
ncbi:uncharacterized protein LOC108701619 [Xenopus laevis]|uniref:Uncharacterized protein LOC108701619 n=2 Tax=Xenopus laevis TaxID=8355 RepID=A0A1L8EYA4_XENLA|nr:uncharacterized protein LOC108701619 [Xenopus laevis]XP_018091979.1 uncharacterized protein LOC108701619 [Xenopus laevis]XP_018091980.1 uncharacterized protein LOC108701619 [Xenopus laevis]XP_018091981.1 uncharacterized protein LOC108701619 [Xenopus laevis]OCT64300.1 hypothetical protein XELAEV_18045403mg [Xenopus laevis]